MDEYIAEAFHPEAIRKSLADARISVWLALDGHHMVGYAKLVRYQYPSHQRLGPWANLEKLYLSPQAQNQGVGSQLMRVVLDTVQQERFERLWVGVWGSVNQGAVRFYERWGFAHTGHYDFKMGGKVYQDWLMELPLPAQTYS
jgi:GNAT superfamily N-acetyltransferase